MATSLVQEYIRTTTTSWRINIPSLFHADVHRLLGDCRAAADDVPLGTLLHRQRSFAGYDEESTVARGGHRPPVEQFIIYSKNESGGAIYVLMYSN